VVVSTPLGGYRGKRSGASESFIGIRYAEEPARFEPAVQLTHTHVGIANATSPGPSCVQTGEGAEDCLFLNVWRPRHSTSQEPLLPVLFWVHGGGFVTGSGFGPLTDGKSMVSTNNVILVTINYRLGPLGFLVTGSQGKGGLNGIMDMVVALGFVRDNIRSFGGDPQKVTVFGESAGGCATCLLSALPAAKGLLRASIVESGPCVGPWGPQSPEKGTSDATAVAQHAGASDVDALRDRKNIPRQNLSAWAPTTMTGGWYHDAALLHKPVAGYFSGAKADLNVQAMIIGGTSYDATAFLYPFAPHKGTNEAYVAATNMQWSSLGIGADYRNDAYTQSTGRKCHLPNASSVRLLYPMEQQNAPPVQSMGAFAQQAADYTVTCPNLHLASLVAITSKRGGVVPVWSYQFAHYNRGCDLAFVFSEQGPAKSVPVSPPTTTSNPQWASHGSELPFVFGNTAFPLSAAGPEITCPFSLAEQGLSSAIMQRWANFATTLDPNTSGQNENELDNKSSGLDISASPIPIKWERYLPASRGGDGGDHGDKANTELTMVLTLPESKLKASADLAYGKGQPHGKQKVQCEFWASACSNN